jgi:hypothetical protein
MPRSKALRKPPLRSAKKTACPQPPRAEVPPRAHDYNNHRIEELGREKGWKTAQNVAAGVGGLVIPVLWFGMDWQGAAGTEARALQDRQSYLGALAVQKHCGGPPQASQRASTVSCSV